MNPAGKIVRLFALRWRWVVAAAVVPLVALEIGIRCAPLPPALFGESPSSLTLTDKNGTPLRMVRVDGHYASELPPGPLPELCVRAVLAAEDKRFFQHRGVDWLALTRAVTSNARGTRATSGASTITQQLIKISQPRPRTLRTKLIEALAAMRLEREWDKQRILTAYLNRLDFGNLTIGLQAAAVYYFGKEPRELSAAEAALLAGLPKSPTKLNPRRSPAAAQARQRRVLARMSASGWLSVEDQQRAVAEPLRWTQVRREFRAPHFVDLLLRELPRTGGTVITTLDLELQTAAEGFLRDRLTPLREKNVHNAALVVLENRTGHVLALAGSDDWFEPSAGQVNGAWAQRSPGSALKPFLYLLALERGDSPATVVADVPALFPTSTGVYRPENYNQICYGPVSYRFALGNSLNIPAVRVLSSLGGPGPLRARLGDWGVTTLDREDDTYGLGLAIGNAEVRLLELTGAYATLARLGRWQPVVLATEPPLLLPNPALAQREPPKVAPEKAWLLADLLADNDARAIQFGRRSALRMDFPAACKTGTSTDFRDNWAIGYTPEFTVGVWVGNFDGSPMRDVSGVTGAAPMMRDLLGWLNQQRGTTWYERPADIIEATVHPLTGHRVPAERADAVREKFSASEPPPLESPADYGPDGRVVLGPEYRDWLASAGGTRAKQIADEPSTGRLRIVSPVPGTTFVLDPDVPTTRRIPLKATGKNIVWSSPTLDCADGLAAAREGTHRLTAQDAATGETAETWVVVKGL